jgi:hypothetical protein
MMMAMENKIIQNFTKQQNLCASFQHKQRVEWRGEEWSRKGEGSSREQKAGPTHTANANAHSSLPLLLLLLLLFLFKN